MGLELLKQGKTGEYGQRRGCPWLKSSRIEEKTKPKVWNKRTVEKSCYRIVSGGMPIRHYRNKDKSIENLARLWYTFDQNHLASLRISLENHHSNRVIGLYGIIWLMQGENLKQNQKANYDCNHRTGI